MKWRTYINKSKTGHYTVTLKAMTPRGTQRVPDQRRGLIDNLAEARRIAALLRNALEKDTLYGVQP